MADLNDYLAVSPPERQSRWRTREHAQAVHAARDAGHGRVRTLGLGAGPWVYWSAVYCHRL